MKLLFVILAAVCVLLEIFKTNRKDEFSHRL